MTDPRDTRPRLTPPPSISAQLAAPIAVEHEPTGVTQIPVGGESTVQAIDRRSRETKNVTLETLSEVSLLRQNTRDDIAAVNRRVDESHTKIDGVIALVGNMRTELAGGLVASTEQNKLIVDMLKDQNESRKLQEQTQATVTTTTHIAEVEVTKTRELSNIEVAKTGQLDKIAAKKWTRELIGKAALKVLGVAAALVGAAIGGGYALVNCGCTGG